MSSEGKDEVGIREAVAGFYKALAAIFVGDSGPMQAMWSHADDVTYMGPDGSFQVGWDAVLANWQMQAEMKLGGTVSPVDMRVALGRDLAVTWNYEKGENINTGEGPGAVWIRATNVFRKEGDAWKMIGHHTDLLSYLAEPK
jgi:ketosteroid isomerase-like protein